MFTVCVYKSNNVFRALHNMTLQDTTVQFSWVRSLDRLGRWGEGGGGMADDSAEIIFQSFLQEATVSSFSVGRYVHSLICPSSISYADHGVAHPPGCPEEWFWRGCRGVRHARTMQVTVSWQLPENGPEDPQGRFTCSTPSRWSCALSTRYGEVSLFTCFWKPRSFLFQSQQTGSIFRSHRGRWRCQETNATWICLLSWQWCCARAWLIWPLLSLLRQFWCRFLLSR